MLLSSIYFFRVVFTRFSFETANPRPPSDVYARHADSPTKHAFHSEEDTWFAGRMHALRDQLPLALPPRRVSHRFAAETMLLVRNRTDEAEAATASNRTDIEHGRASGGGSDAADSDSASNDDDAVVEPIFLHAAWKCVREEVYACGCVFQYDRDELFRCVRVCFKLKPHPNPTFIVHISPCFCCLVSPCCPRRYLDPSLLVALLARTQRFYWPDADAAFGAADASATADPYLSADELRAIRERVKSRG